MSAQTTYERLTGARMHGSLSDMNNSDVTSAAAEAAIPVGVAVKLGTAEGQVLVADGVTGYLGVAIRDLSREGVLNTNSLDYLVEENVSVLRSGYINLTCPTGCTQGALVKFINASGVIDAGAAAAGETQLTGATWETTTAAAGVGIVRLKPQTTPVAGV